MGGRVTLLRGSATLLRPLPCAGKRYAFASAPTGPLPFLLLLLHLFLVLNLLCSSIHFARDVSTASAYLAEAGASMAGGGVAPSPAAASKVLSSARMHLRGALK